MNEETYLRAKVIMDEVDQLRHLKNFEYPAECYSISFNSRSGRGVTANATNIGTNGMEKLVNVYTEIIDNLIAKNLRKLEGLE